MVILPTAIDFKRRRVESSENIKNFLKELNSLDAKENKLELCIPFTPDELSYIKARGYSIAWSSPCKWWVVSF